MRYAFVVSVVLLLASCSKPFQPVAPGYKLWSKNGVSDLAIKKSMLECGVPSVDPVINSYEYAFGIKYEEDDKRLNKGFLEDLCMESLGYIPREYTVHEYCSWERYNHLAACQPNAKIPTPSVERRLNSWYCKIKTDYEYCLEHAVNPPACNPEGYKNPPPECLP